MHASTKDSHTGIPVCVDVNSFISPCCVTGMKITYVLILEGDTGKGFSAWFPDLPGVFACGDSRRQVEALAKEAAEDELQEVDNLPPAKLRSSREVELLLRRISTEEKLDTENIQVEVPEDLVVVKK